MSAATLTEYNPLKKSTRLVTLENFHRLYADKEDGYKYEWNNGIVEKAPRTMKRDQLLIADLLTRYFIQTEAYRNRGALSGEVEMFLPHANRTRIGDLAYLTFDQLKEKDNATPSVCTFVIEVVSKTDNADDMKTKLQEYFDNGVQVVWQIFPKHQLVEVYTSLEHVKICRGTTVCSAMPALPDFNIPAQDIFMR